MTPAEAAELLAIAAAFDNRQVSEIAARAWAKALYGLPSADCAAAIEAHYSRSTDYLMPAHIRGEVRRVRDERIKADMTDPPYPGDDVAAGLAAIRAHRRAVGDGHRSPPQIGDPGRADAVRALAVKTLERLPRMPQVSTMGDY